MSGQDERWVWPLPAPDFEVTMSNSAGTRTTRVPGRCHRRPFIESCGYTSCPCHATTEETP